MTLAVSYFDPAPAFLAHDLKTSVIPHYQFYLSAAPILLLLIGGLAVILLGSFQNKQRVAHSFNVIFAASISFLAAVSSIIFYSATPHTFLDDAFLVDALSQKSMFVLSTGLLFLILCSYTTTIGKMLCRFEMLTLLMFATAGMMVVVSSNEFASFFVGLELFSIPLYVLIAYQRPSREGFEGGIKYFLNGAAGSALLLFGAALIYASIGTLNFSAFHNLKLSPSSPFGFLGFLSLTLGLLFKLGGAPVHSWVADAYEGANSHLSGFMAGFVKFTILVVFIRLFSIPYQSITHTAFIKVFALFSFLSLGIGSLYGLVHNSVKRIFAYSSVANAGYLLVGLTALLLQPGKAITVQALFSYAVIYAIFSFSGYQLLAWLEENNHENLMKEELFGIASKKTFFGVAFSMVLFGLGGIPPLAGFIGKYFLMIVALNQGLYFLTVALVVFSVVSLFFYLNLCSGIWFRTSHKYTAHNSQSVKVNTTMSTLLFFLVVLMIVIGIFGPRFAYHL